MLIGEETSTTNYHLFGCAMKKYSWQGTCSKQDEFIGGVGLGPMGVLPPQNLRPEVTCHKYLVVPFLVMTIYVRFILGSIAVSIFVDILR